MTEKVDFKKLHEQLKNGPTLIKFKSILSGRVIIGEYTLMDAIVKQQQPSDKILAWDVNENKYEDIQLNTIIYYEQAKRV